MLNSILAMILLVSVDAKVINISPPAGWKVPQRVTDSGCDR